MITNGLQTSCLKLHNSTKTDNLEKFVTKFKEKNTNTVLNHCRVVNTVLLTLQKTTSKQQTMGTRRNIQEENENKKIKEGKALGQN